MLPLGDIVVAMLSTKLLSSTLLDFSCILVLLSTLEQLKMASLCTESSLGHGCETRRIFLSHKLAIHIITTVIAIGLP